MTEPKVIRHRRQPQQPDHPPSLLHVIWFCAGVLAVYVILIVLAMRVFGWMP